MIFSTNKKLSFNPQSLTGKSALLALHTVLGAPLLSLVHALRVKSAADDVVAHAREIPDSAAANENDRVLLQIVADAGDIAT